MSLTSTLTQNYPISGSLAEKLYFLLQYAIHAPSPQNTQPWGFEIDERGVNVLLDGARVLRVADPAGRSATISVGSVIGHLELSMRAHHLRPRTRYVHDSGRPELLARIESEGEFPTTSSDIDLFSQVFRRHTATKFQVDSEVPPAVLAALTQAAVDRGCGMRWLDRGPMQSSFAHLIQEADETLFSGKRFREEFAEWIRARSDEGGDGVPVEALGTAHTWNRLVPWLIGHLDVGAIVGKEELLRAITAPALGVLFTNGDARDDWLDAGRALSDILLLTTQMGFQAAVFEEPMNSQRFRLKLDSLLNTDSPPQVVLRLGKASDVDVATTSRRPIQEFIGAGLFQNSRQP